MNTQLLSAFHLPDDWHVHLREGTALETTVPETAKRNRRALVMPNLSTPITTPEQMVSYRDQIQEIADRTVKTHRFKPLMTYYLTADHSPHDIWELRRAGATAAKWYPKGKTHNSAHGLCRIRDLHPDVYKALEQSGTCLAIHAEDPAADPLEAERMFLMNMRIRTGDDLLDAFPKLQVSIEHLSTWFGVDWVKHWYGKGRRVFGTITPQHLQFTIDVLLGGKFDKLKYCKPVYKFERDRLALQKAALSGLACFGAGTDSAPHDESAKNCGCPGAFVAPVSFEMYYEVFASPRMLDNLEKFTSVNGAVFYGELVQPDEATVCLQLTEPGKIMYRKVGDYFVPEHSSRSVMTVVRGAHYEEHLWAVCGENSTTLQSAYLLPNTHSPEEDTHSPTA